jgi:hypothetical protein
MWDEIMDMPGEIFDFSEEDRKEMMQDWAEIQEENEEPGWDLNGFDDIDDRDMMPLDMQDDIEKDDPLLDD